MSEIVPIVPENLAEGNTSSSAKKQVSCAIKWCFTLNNFTEKDINDLCSSFSSNCESYIFENEIGEEGTPHLQGFIIFEKKRRPDELKLSKAIHWEKCKGTKQDNILYCSKDYREKVSGTKVYKSGNINIPKPLKLITPDREYQKFILKICEDEPSERDVYWFYDEIGNVGKSQFSKYLMAKRNAIYIDEGKKPDIAQMFKDKFMSGDIPDIVCIDIPRENENNCSYKSIEAIKGGIMFSPKYESGSILFNSPHLFIFSNYLPNKDKLSKDRWKIYEITSDYKVLPL